MISEQKDELLGGQLVPHAMKDPKGAIRTKTRHLDRCCWTDHERR